MGKYLHGFSYHIFHEGITIFNFLRFPPAVFGSLSSSLWRHVEIDGSWIRSLSMKRGLEGNRWNKGLTKSLWGTFTPSHCGCKCVGVVAESLCLGGCRGQRSHPTNIADVVHEFSKIGLYSQMPCFGPTLLRLCYMSWNHLSVYLSSYWAIYLSTLSVCLSIYLSIYQSIKTHHPHMEGPLFRLANAWYFWGISRILVHYVGW